MLVVSISQFSKIKTWVITSIKFLKRQTIEMVNHTYKGVYLQFYCVNNFFIVLKFQCGCLLSPATIMNIQILSFLQKIPWSTLKANLCHTVMFLVNVNNKILKQLIWLEFVLPFTKLLCYCVTKIILKDCPGYFLKERQDLNIQ